MEHSNQQTSDHEKNLQGQEAIDKLKELAGKAKTCFFCNDIKTGVPFSARPMTILQVDDAGHFWFLSKRESQKNEELGEDPFVHLLFQGGSFSGFLDVYGMSYVNRDQEKISELWSPALDVWFDGKEDPSISVIRVEPLQAHYWDNEHGPVTAFLKMAAGMVTGKRIHDGVHGDLDI